MDVINISRQVEERYRRYLKTTFYFKDPQLRRSFWDALDSAWLSKGPFLEATPVFKQGKTPAALFQELLGFPIDEGFSRAIHGDRPLYLHQEDAVRHVANGRNVIVATGTGSGKTESFLMPILLHLYGEFQRGKLGPGVRALILYPMNALANDQRERLGEVCRLLKEFSSPFRFTFGQYIGETPEDESDLQRHAKDRLATREQDGYSIVEGGKVVHGEMVLRSEMRDTPPHILLTNYSMLEYLLLRPNDSPLFDNGRARWWTFLVLDEAHQYRGSRGIEMAMLLRRLKQRLREGGRRGPLRCIATSATLMGGEGHTEAVAKFATDLFGEFFHEEDVILGETEPISAPCPGRLDPEDYSHLKQFLSGNGNNPGELTRMAERIGVSLDLDLEDDPRTTVGILLQRDGRSVGLSRLITGNPIEVQKIADAVFDDVAENQRLSSLAELVDLLVKAQDPSSGAPLLSVRYHLFLRSLEGTFVSYWPEKKVFLDRKTDRVAFEVALCRECGQHYFIAQKNFSTGKIQEPIRDPADIDFGATFLRPVLQDEDQKKPVLYLCVQCGTVSRRGPACGHDNFIRVVKEQPPRDEDRADQLARCGACGYTAAGRDPVREVVHGADGPHAVIATTLFKALPKERRKVLAFADGRQEAAFFAWYLEDSYRDILGRNLLLKTVRRLSNYTQEGLSLRELAIALRSVFREQEVFPPSTGDLELLREAWLSLYREFLTGNSRISLEGLGLVHWSIRWPDWFEMPQVLEGPPWSLTRQEASDLILVLLDTLRNDRAVELRTKGGIPLNWEDLNLMGQQMRFTIGVSRGRRDVRSWDNRHGKRAQFLARVLMEMRGGLSDQKSLHQAEDVLREIWKALCDADAKAPSSQDHLLLSIDDARRLNSDWWRLHALRDEGTLFQCDTCGRVQAVSVRGVCPRYGCSGTLRPVQVRELESNHYRLLYQEDLPGVLRVEEHTAQLDREKAREFQQAFKDGRIHVLSCSTTFELGVDLGDLDTIFLRNVPPEAFNYAQRVGRAGRRRGYPGFAITYCKRSPHDLYHFAQPELMLNGVVRPPVLSLCNEKIVGRHITAIALSRFFREFPERFKTVENLFEDLEGPCGVHDFREFLIQHSPELEKTLRAIIPPHMVRELGIDNGEWIDKISGEKSRFSLAEAEVCSDYRIVNALERKASHKKRYKVAAWARARARTISGENVLSFLSRKAVIPKYGFPVDVVELDTQRTQKNQEAFEVMLQRDLGIAISEFAPTSKLVANKKEWTSYGLKKVVGREWPRSFYKRCTQHNVFLQWLHGQDEPPSPCGDRLMVSQYVVPCFGFVTGREKPKKPRSRSTRVFSTRPYFAGPLGPEPGTISFPGPDTPLITVRKASPGRMVVLCEGRRGEGFYICRECGAGFRNRPRIHKTPYGHDCSGMLEQVSLGYEFVTDVLQLQFHPKPWDGIDPVWFTYSLAYALVEGSAEVLEIPSVDLSATVAYSEQYPVLPIIIYDNVPGGAGLVARLEDEGVLMACLASAQKRVSGACGCDENTSCYGCLRSYRNQFAHQKLERGPVLHYLDALRSTWQ